MQNLEQFKAIIDRMHSLYNTRTVKELFAKLGVPKGTYDSWRNKKKIPNKYIIKVAEDKGVTIDWLLHGTSPKFKISKIPEPFAYEYLSNPLTNKLCSLFALLPSEKKQELYPKLRDVIKAEIE